VLRLYNDKTQQIEEWTDVDYKAYFLASAKLDQPIKGVINSEDVIKYDALQHKHVTMNKTYLAYPSYVKQTHGMPQVYENHVKFFQGYIYDKNIMMGMPYERKDGKLEFVADSEAEKRVEQVLKLMKIDENDKSCFETWARLLEYSAPNFKRASLDLEIMNEIESKVPNAESANLPILCACLASNTGERIALILLRENKVLDVYPDSCTQTIFFSSEIELIKMIFRLFSEYPFIITFNGDDFDLKYLAMRALRLGIPEAEIPIEVRDRITLLTKGIHIDLYKFFYIRAMQIYAFQQKYKTIDLDTISKALINKGKIQTGKWVNDLSYSELVNYCMRDAELTLELTTFNDNLVMNLMLVLNRISRMPIENVSRKSVSSWILSFLICAHRKTVSQLMSNSMKRLIYQKLYYCNHGVNNQCPIQKMKEELMTELISENIKTNSNLENGEGKHPEDFMKNTERKKENDSENDITNLKVIPNSKNDGVPPLENGINQIKELNLEKNIEQKQEKHREDTEKNMATNLEKNTKNICANIEEESVKSSENGDKKREENSLLSEVQNVKDVEILMREYLKSIIKRENVKREEIVLRVLEKIGQNCNYCVPIVTELFTQKDVSTLIPNADEIKTMKSITSSTAVVKGKKYKGAIVIPPKTGIHFNVKVGDFASLYPSIIKVYNIGYSTIDCPHLSCKPNTVGELPHWMCLKEKSLESILIGSLRDLRVNWYKKKAKDKELPKSLRTWYSVAEQSIKVILNASYGVLGSESFEMYCPPAAEEITAIGRYIIGQTIKHGQELGLEILYGDTDSIFIKNPLKEVLDQLIAWAKQEFDIEFELDKSYRYVCLSERKKNYLGVLEDGFVDVKGLTGKKKHTPPIIKNAFDNTKVILSQVNSEQDMTLAKHKIIDLLKFNYRILKERKWSNLADLAFNVGITKEISEYGKANEKGERTEKGIPQHVRAAKMLNSEDIGIGSSIKFVKVNPKLCRGENVKPLELAKTEDIDVEKYIEYLRTTFEQILDSLNLSFEKDILGVTRMDNWMNQN
jgi:DNA polymerase elongation subunit (family B)